MAVWGHPFPSNFLPFPFHFHFHTALYASELCACIYATTRVLHVSILDVAVSREQSCAWMLPSVSRDEIIRMLFHEVYNLILAFLVAVFGISIKTLKRGRFALIYCVGHDTIPILFPGVSSIKVVAFCDSKRQQHFQLTTCVYRSGMQVSIATECVSSLSMVALIARTPRA